MTSISVEVCSAGVTVWKSNDLLLPIPNILDIERVMHSGSYRRKSGIGFLFPKYFDGSFENAKIVRGRSGFGPSFSRWKAMHFLCPAPHSPQLGNRHPAYQHPQRRGSIAIASGTGNPFPNCLQHIYFAERDRREIRCFFRTFQQEFLQLLHKLIGEERLVDLLLLKVPEEGFVGLRSSGVQLRSEKV